MTAREQLESAEATVRLADDQLEALADLVTARLAALLPSRPVEAPRPSSLVDAAALGRALGVDRATVYAHADELGAIRLGEAGEGRRPRLRFDLEEAVSRWTSRGSGERSEERSRPVVAPSRTLRRRSGAGTGDALLPVRGLDEAARAA